MVRQFVLWGMAGALWLAGGAAVGAAPALAVKNLAAGTTLRYPVVILRGEAEVPDGTELTVMNLASKRDSRFTRVAVTGKRFKTVAELVPGENRLQFTAGEAQLTLPLSYKPQTNPYYVRVVYYTDRDGTTAYQSERQNDPQDYKARLSTCAKLLQAFTAESMNDQGLGRSTFNLQFDAEGEVVVHTVRGGQPMEYYHGRDGNQLWQEIYADLNRRMPDRYAKNLVVMAFTRFDPVSKTPKAHTALGGGNLGLFGSAGMFTWPGRVADIPAAFNDTTRVDPTRTHNDSNGRSNYWGLASTTLGAVIHEMGHTFGLPHSNDPFDIMTRGFDFLNRAFTVVEPPSARRNEVYPFRDAEVAQFRPISAQRLAPIRWFRTDGRPEVRDPQLGVEVDAAAGKVIVRSAEGLRVVGINGGGDAQENDYFSQEAPRQKEYSLEELRRRARGKELSLVLINAAGNEVSVGAERLK